MQFKFTSKLKTILLTLVLTVAMTTPLISANIAHAQENSAQAACESLSVIDGSGSCNDPPGEVGIDSALQDALNILSLAAGIIAVIVIMIAGTRYILSEGDSKATGQARSTIIYAAIGLVIVALAQIIVRFIIAVS